MSSRPSLALTPTLAILIVGSGLVCLGAIGFLVRPEVSTAKSAPGSSLPLVKSKFTESDGAPVAKLPIPSAPSPGESLIPPANHPISSSPATTSPAVPPIATATFPSPISPPSVESAAAPALPSAASLSRDLPGAAEPVALDPRKPGNSFRSSSVRVSVAGSYATAEGPALAVDFSRESDASPAPQGTEEVVTAPSPASPPPATKPDSNSTPAITPRPSVTVDGSPLATPTDEELFRMKWGWDAYDQAQREAVREAGRNATPTP